MPVKEAFSALLASECAQQAFKYLILGISGILENWKLSSIFDFKESFNLVKDCNSRHDPKIGVAYKKNM